MPAAMAPGPLAAPRYAGSRNGIGLTRLGDRLEQHRPLALRPAHEPDVPHREVTEASVHELRGRARGGAAEIAGVNQRDAETATRGLERDARADDPGADHQQLDRTLPKPLESLRPPHVRTRPPRPRSRSAPASRTAARDKRAGRRASKSLRAQAQARG